MLNDYVWKNYLKAGGSIVVEIFTKSLTKEYSTKYADMIKKLHIEYCPCKSIIRDTHEQLIELSNWLISLKSGYSIESALNALWKEIVEENDNDITDAEVFEVFISNMTLFTTKLSIELPALFVPYYFECNFNFLVEIFDAFKIDLPTIPLKKDYKERFYYYGEVCKALNNFRDEHNMTPYELCAFLYDFAPKYVGGTDSYIIKNLPVPKSAFFVGGSKNDVFLENSSNSITPWQCNPEIHAGDMIVMYLRSPVSAVDSIWRSLCIGFIDPFFYYYRCTYIGNPVSAKGIAQKQMKSDEMLGKMPIVKKNMQGINGVELKPSEYNHIVELSKSNAIKLEYVFENNDSIFTCEKDVENKLIKPLLKKLGYTENDYEQQLRIKIGNHNTTEIPDFVLLPKKSRGVQTAFTIIEAKRIIKNSREFEDVKEQARSYAMQLSVRYAVVADMNKLWVFDSGDYYVDEVMTVNWSELGNSDVFAKLYKMIGNAK